MLSPRQYVDGGVAIARRVRNPLAGRFADPDELCLEHAASGAREGNLMVTHQHFVTRRHG